jgi:hypothetical protein
MRLVHDDTGLEVEVGETVTDFRGEKARVVSIERPHHAGSTGRIYVQPLFAEWTQGYYPSVFNCTWIEREDRAHG